MLAPIAWRVPPRGYGPWERLVGLLAEGLVARQRTRDRSLTAQVAAHGTAVEPHSRIHGYRGAT